MNETKESITEVAPPLDRLTEGQDLPQHQAHVLMETKRKKVAIVGSASSSADEAPWKDLDFEIWGLGWRIMERGDRYFDMHKLGPHRKHVQADYERHLSMLNAVVYLQEAHPNIANSVRYPIEDVIKMLAGVDPFANGDYFASSVAFMLAMSIFEGFEEIHLYGIDLLTDSEYTHQRPNAEYLIGLARGMGRRVYVPKSSAMLKFSYRYGYDERPSVGAINPAILNERLKQYQAKHKHAIAEMYTADGAAQECNQLLQLLNFHDRGGVIDQISPTSPPLNKAMPAMVQSKPLQPDPSLPKQEKK